MLTKQQDEACNKLGFVPEPGVWKCGPHTIVLGDLEDPDVLDTLLELGPWDACWTDPPWNLGIGTTFRVQAGVGGEANLERLFQALGEVLGWVKDAALIWTNTQLLPAVHAAMEIGDFKRTCEFKVTYSRFAHATPVTVGVRDHVELDGLNLDQLHGGRVIAKRFLEWYGKPCRLVDPFVGQDVGAYVASEKVQLTGAEVHPGRAAVTLARLAKISRAAPTRT
jgi:hypothetical protein